MKVEMPEFILELSSQMNNQSSRCTSHPFWTVRHKEYVVTEQGYNDHHFEVFETEDNTTLYRSDNSDGGKVLVEHLIEYNEDFVIDWMKWHSEHDDYDDEMNIAELAPIFTEEFWGAFDVETDTLPDNVAVIYMQAVEKTVWTGLTEVAALAFIGREQHNYPELYTYVESAYWSPQFSQLMDWLKGIDDA